MLIPAPDKAVMEQKVVRSLDRIHELGKYLLAQYADTRQSDRPVSNTIRRHEILTFGNRSDVTKKETKRVMYRR